MQLKLFDRKRRNLNTFLRQNDQVITLSGFGSTIILGTQMGCLHIFNVTKNWTEQANVQLSEEKNCKTAVTQISCASALGLIFSVFGEELFALLFDKLTLEKLFNKARRISLNSHPAIDDPFVVHLAIAHSQKQQILVGKLSGDSIQFSKEQTLSTTGKVQELVFSGQCICYANDAGAYFVYNIQEKSAIHLFDASIPKNPHVICTFGMEEFLLAGIHKLLMFVDGRGASTRAPISLPDEYGAVGLTLKEPFIYLLDTAGMLFVFSTMDNQLKQCLPFPNDHEGDETSQHFQVTYQLVNIDGQLFVLPPSGDCIFEIVPMPILSQIDEHIQLGQVNIAIEMLEKNYTEICTSTDEQEIFQLRKMQQKIAFLFLQRGESEKAIDLLVNSEANPQPMLFLLKEQYDQQLCLQDVIINNEDNRNFFKLEKPPIDGKFERITLETFMQYFEAIYYQRWASDYIKLIENILARIYFLLDDYNKADDFLVAARVWNNPLFRHWLANTDDLVRLNCAAKLAADVECFVEAFSIWKRMAVKQQIGPNKLADCFQTLFKIQSGNLMACHALPWLAPIDAITCMDAIENLEESNPEQSVQPEIVVKIFQQVDQNDDLIFNYLYKRIYALDSSIFHNKMLDLFIHKIKQSPDKIQRQTVCKQLRHFLVFSNHYDRERARRQFSNYIENDDDFRIETVLAMANDNTALECLIKLTESIENEEDAIFEEKKQQNYDDILSVAKLLCSRYPKSELLKYVLNIHLRLSRTDPTFRTQITHILSLMENEADAVEVLKNLPDDFDSCLFVHNFLHRHVANRLNAQKWRQTQQQLNSIERHRLEAELAMRLGKTHFRQDEHSRCGICEKALIMGQEFIWYPRNGVLAHQWCHALRRENKL